MPVTKYPNKSATITDTLTFMLQICVGGKIQSENITENHLLLHGRVKKI